MTKLLAIQTKSNGWVNNPHSLGGNSFLDFRLGRDNTIEVSKREGNYCTISYTYPKDDILDYIIAKEK